MTQPSGGRPNQPSPQEFTDPQGMRPESRETTDAATVGRPTPDLTHHIEDSATAERPDTGEGTVESGPAGFPAPPGYPSYAQRPPPSHYGPPPGYGPPASSGYGPTVVPGDGRQPPGPDPRPARHRGVLIASIVLATALLLCGGGGFTAFLLLRDEGGEGAPEPVAAADGFLRAVYLDQDPDKAAGMVCPAARNRAKIVKKVAEIQDYRETYKNPRFRWTPPVVTDQGAEQAVVTTKLTMITGDERFSEQQLTLTVVRQSGWWVCEVS